MADYYRITLLKRDTGIAAYCKQIDPRYATGAPCKKYTPERFECNTKEELWEQVQKKCAVNRRYIRRGKWVVTTEEKLEADDEQ